MLLDIKLLYNYGNKLLTANSFSFAPHCSLQPSTLQGLFHPLSVHTTYFFQLFMCFNVFLIFGSNTCVIKNRSHVKIRVERHTKKQHDMCHCLPHALELSYYIHVRNRDGTYAYFSA